METATLQPERDSRHAVADRTGIKAGFVSRAVAFVLDLLIILILAGATYLLIKGTLTLMRIDLSQCTQFVPIVDARTLIANFCALMRILMLVTVLSIAPLYLLALWLFAGRTVGMGIAGLRVVRTDGKRMRLPAALLRLVGFTFSILTLGIGFLWAIVDNDRQALHDKIAGTVVIYWTGMMLHPRPPLPEKGVLLRVPKPTAGNAGGQVPALNAPATANNQPADA